MIECPVDSFRYAHLPILKGSPWESLRSVTQHLQLTGLVTVTVHTERSHDLIHGLSRRLVFVEEVSGKQDHVDIFVFGEAHDFVKAFPAVIATDGITLIVPNMVICGYQNANRIRPYK